MRVKIKKLHPDAVIPFQTYDDDFCFDCIATSCEEIAPNVYKYGLGLAFEIERGESYPILGRGVGKDLNDEKDNDIKKFAFSICFDYRATPSSLSIDFRPRSSVWKTGMVLSNCTGTVDEGYRGEVSAVFYHVMPNMPKYEVGDKIIQCKLGMTLPMDFIEVDELTDTERGKGGYGSTGK